MNLNFKWIMLIVLLGIAACKKNTESASGGVVYEETITDIKKNEPLLLTFNNSNNTQKVNWTITPSAGTSISAVGNNATITFSEAGTYKIIATAGTLSAVYTVVIINTWYIDYGTTFTLSASKLVNINQGEPVNFAVYNISAGSHIQWSVFSNSAFNIATDTINNTAVITFTGGGDFASVSASDGVHTQRRTVFINDPGNANPNLDTVSFILGEKLKITPSVVIIGGSKQLVMEAATTNNYHCPTDKILSYALNNDYTIDYAGVAISPQPCIPAGVATSINSFGNLPVGTHVFTVNFGNKTYEGSLKISTSGIYTFTWPDASVVNIFPLEVR